METVLETFCVSRLGKSDIRAGRPLVNYLLIIERGAVGDSPPPRSVGRAKIVVKNKWAPVSVGLLTADYYRLLIRDSSLLSRDA